MSIHDFDRTGLILAALIGIGALLSSDPARANNLPAAISSEQAIARAVNDIEKSGDGYVLRHPRHDASFNRDGIRFAPRGGDFDWRWRLRSARTGAVHAAALAEPQLTARDGVEVISYDRGLFREEYLAKKGTIEQQFVIPRLLAGGDLVIEGAVESGGAFETRTQSWVWRRGKSTVSLGQVYAYDRNHKPLAARMIATRDSTMITVDGAALEKAEYPVIIDPEIGTNDQRISDMGPDNITSFDASTPAVAYNATNNEFLVVWAANDDGAGLDPSEFEIYGQLIAASGAEVGTNDFRISTMGVDGNATQNADQPDVTWNSSTNQYMVVWRGDNFTGASSPAPQDNEFEIWGQRVSDTGALAGGVIRMSNMGTDGAASFQASSPDVEYNSIANEYLVVWSSDDNDSPGGILDNTFEIFGRRFSILGVAQGATHFRISNMTPDLNTSFNAFEPAVAHNSGSGEYMVVWHGDRNDGVTVDEEFEIFGQLLDGTGAEIGSDFRLSSMGTDGTASAQRAETPAIAYNPFANQYLVVWRGDEILGEFEIYGQLVAATGSVTGPDDFQISEMGSPPSTTIGAGIAPAVTFSDVDGLYLVTWWGDDNLIPLVDDEFEIFARAVDMNGIPLGLGAPRISDIGPDLDTTQAARFPAIAYNSFNNRSLIVFEGDDLTAGEIEIHSQLSSEVFADLDLLVAESADPAIVGGSLNYTVTITNSGPDPAFMIKLTDTLPTDLTGVSAIGSGWVCVFSGQTVDCDLPFAPPGPLPALVISTTVNSTSATSVTNRVLITTVQSFDPVLSNNDVSVVTSITAVPTATPTATVTPTATPTTVPAVIPTLDRPKFGSRAVNPVFSGSAFPGATITLKLDGSTLSPTVNADSNGAWTFPFSGTLALGTHTLEVNSVDPLSRATDLNPLRSFVVTGGAPLDFDGDGLTDEISYSSFGGTVDFRVGDSSSGASIRIPIPGEVPAPGDYDGDEIIDFATIGRNGNNLEWTIVDGFSGLPATTFAFGERGSFAVTGCRFVSAGITSAAVFSGGVLSAVNAASPGTVVSSAEFPSGSRIIGCIDTDGDKLDEVVLRRAVDGDSLREKISIGKLDATEVSSFSAKKFFKGYVVPGLQLTGGRIALVRQRATRVTLSVHSVDGTLEQDDIRLPRRGILSSGLLLGAGGQRTSGVVIYNPADARRTDFYDLSVNPSTPVRLGGLASGFKLVQTQYVFKSTPASGASRVARR